MPLFGAAIMYFFYPETKGLSLEEISAKFGDTVAVDYTRMDEEARRKLDKGLALGMEVELVEDTGRDVEKHSG